ncbi:MAG TPA: lysylphosphatidylglycerol synthase transmembrane domain-containing protein [Candidatus Limnocylindrales bacterium]|nr:lysylphosphatidylglycerol synthase transmembrane domain-containing protein [Candidatus Limnocylindrales bacterium]
MQRSARRYLLLLLALAALAFFLYKFRNSISIQGFAWSMVAQSIRQARWELLLLALVTIYFCYLVRTFRWMRFSRTLGETSLWNVYSGTLIGFACTFLLGRAGEPVRPILIAKKDNIPVASMFGVYVLERVADMAATAVLAGTALILFERRGLMPGTSDTMMTAARSAGVALLVVLVAAIGFLVYFRYHGAAWLVRRLENPKWRAGWREKIAVLLEGFSDGLQGIRTWSDLGVLIFYTALHWICVALVYLWVAQAFGGELAQLTFAGALLVLAFTMVGSAVQLPGVGGGAQLATFLVLTLFFGVEKEPAATMAIVVWLISFAGSCLLGLPLLFREGWSMGELRRMAQAEERAGEAALLAEAERGEGPLSKSSGNSGEQTS